MRLSALESVRNAAEDLIKQSSNSQDDAVKGQYWISSKSNTAPLIKCGLVNVRSYLYYMFWFYHN